MTLRFTAVHPAHALVGLANAVEAAKAGEPLRPVTVIVPTNAAGVTARRYLGRAGGVTALDALTLDRLAEVVAGPGFAKHGRHPISAPVVELTVRAVLNDDPGMFAPVASHASTVTALRNLHSELRLSGPTGLAQLLEASDRGREAGRIVSAVNARLADDWYDRADLLTEATRLIEGGARPPAARHVIVLLPRPFRPLETTLLGALGQHCDVQVLFGYTGEPDLDRTYIESADQLAAPVELAADTTATDHPAVGPYSIVTPSSIVSVTDADEEVRHAVRVVLDRAGDDLPFDRIAILWPQDEPYARLVEHHLRNAGLPWNGRPGTQVGERIVPRFLLDLLELDRRGLRRTSVFELLTDINVRTANGENAPTARWERVARSAGVATGDDWRPRLTLYAQRQQQIAAARGNEGAWRADDALELLKFVDDLRGDLGSRHTRRTWTEWSSWAQAQIEKRLPTDALTGRAEAERLASDHTLRVLDRLAYLDNLGGDPVTRVEFREVFAAEFEVAPGRLGRLGRGITVGSLASQSTLDADLVIVLGAADGVLPPPPHPDPLLSARDSAAAMLQPVGAPAHNLRRQFLAVMGGAATTVVTYPRGDLRGTVERQPSRWLASTPTPFVELASHHAALLDTGFPVNESEFRLRDNLASSTSTPITPDLARDDPVLEPALVLRAARRSTVFTEYDGNLAGVELPRFDHAISPTQIETWPSCPHTYFQRYLLGVHDDDDPVMEFAITPLKRGNLLHETLDRLHREVIDGTLPQPADGWTDDHFKRATELFDEVAELFQRTGRTGRPASWAIERRALRADLIGWLNADSARLRGSGAKIVSSEARFGGDNSVTLPLTDGRRLAVAGSIDRIDEYPDGHLVVIDHKTGKPDRYKKLTVENPTNDGTMFQLPVYGAGARAIMQRPDAPIEAKYSMFKGGGYAQYGFALTDTIDRKVSTRLTRVIGAIEAGVFPFIPESPSEFKPYVTCKFCNPDGIGTTERFNEFERKLSDPTLIEWLGPPAAEPDDEH